MYANKSRNTHSSQNFLLPSFASGGASGLDQRPLFSPQWTEQFWLRPPETMSLLLPPEAESKFQLPKLRYNTRPREPCLFIALIIAIKIQFHEHRYSGVGPEVGHQWNCVAISDSESKEAAVILNQAELPVSHRIASRLQHIWGVL